MKFARSITTALGGLALVFAATGTAHAAEPEFFFSPSKPWNAGPAAKGEKACAMQAQYNNGYVLRFDGAQGGPKDAPRSFSINFLQDIFEAGKTYPLSLSQDSGKALALEGHATSASVLQASLAGQTGFMTSLRGSSALDVSVEGNKFRFFLQGIKEAAPAFDTCLASAGPMPEAKELRAPLKEAASPAPEQAKTADRKNAGAPAKSIAPVAAVAVGEAEMAKPLLDEPEAKPARVKIATPAPGRITTKRETIKGQADFTAYAQTKPAAGDELPDAADIKAANYAERIAELEKRLSTLQKENKDLSEELSLALEEGKTEHKSIASENWSLERASMRYQEAERQIKKLGLQLQMQRAQCDEEKKDLEAMLFDPAVTNQQQLARLADLEQQLQDAREEIANMRMHANESARIQDALPTP